VATCASQRLSNASSQLLDILGKVVGQVGILGSRSDLLNRVEVRSVRRQPFDVKTSGKAFRQPSRRRAMDQPAIHDENDSLCGRWVNSSSAKAQ